MHHVSRDGTCVICVCFGRCTSLVFPQVCIFETARKRTGAGAEVIPITALSFHELHDICGHDITGRQIQLILVSVSQIVWYFLVSDGFSHFIHFGGHTRCIVLHLHCVEFSVSEKSVCSWKELQQSLTKGLWNLFYSFSVQITAPGCFIINKQTIV